VKIPRDCSGAELARALRHLGYETQRQTGSHLQMTTQRGGEHHVTIPNHRPLKVGLLHGVLKDVVELHHLTVEELVRQLSI
jgi:predicted RNA binding protein YcfA (HicA-like mRNA interferase family)